MGDLLMTLPAIGQVRRGLPGCRITLLIRRELQPLLNGHPDCDRTLGWDPREGQGWAAALRWGKILRRERFDGAVLFNPTKFFHLATFLAGIPHRIGYRRKWGFLLTGSIPDTKANRFLHESEYNLELLPLLGLYPSPPALEWPLQPNETNRAKQFLQNAGLPAGTVPVAIHPWASHPRSWPLESFAVVVRGLRRAGHPVAILGGETEISAMTAWSGSLGSLELLNWVGRIPLALLPAVLRLCRVMLSNDSGPAHVAAAVGTPTVVVAPAGNDQHHRRWQPLGQGHTLLLGPSPEKVLETVLRRCES